MEGFRKQKGGLRERPRRIFEDEVRGQNGITLGYEVMGHSSDSGFHFYGKENHWRISGCNVK